MNSVAAVWAQMKQTLSQQQSGNVAQAVMLATVGKVSAFLLEDLLTSCGQSVKVRELTKCSVLIA